MGKKRIMSKMFRAHRNTIGNLAIALLFVGGCIFLLTGSWDTSESEAAKGCCGSDATATTLTAANTGGCCGGTNRLSGSGENCDCVSSPCRCGNNPACGTGNQRTKPACPDSNSCTNTDDDSPCEGTCDGRICSRANQCNGRC